MASVAQNFMKLFRGSSGGPETTTPAQTSQKLTRRSSGLGEAARSWDTEESLCILDLGSTSPANIRYFTERGHRIYSEDLLTASTEPSLSTKDEQGNPVLDSRKSSLYNRGARAGRLRPLKAVSVGPGSSVGRALH